jgi:hypothetical protein
MLERFDWWGYAILAALPAATFMLGVLWARREMRAGRDPGDGETFSLTWRNGLRGDDRSKSLESDVAVLTQRLASLERAVKLRSPAQAERIPTPV